MCAFSNRCFLTLSKIGLVSISNSGQNFKTWCRVAEKNNWELFSGFDKNVIFTIKTIFCAMTF